MSKKKKITGMNMEKRLDNLPERTDKERRAQDLVY